MKHTLTISLSVHECLQQCAPWPYQVFTNHCHAPQKTDQYGQQLLQQAQCPQHDTLDPTPYRPLPRWSPICDNFQHSKEHIPRLPKSVHGYSFSNSNHYILQYADDTCLTVHPHATLCSDKWWMLKLARARLWQLKDKSLWSQATQENFLGSTI